MVVYLVPSVTFFPGLITTNSWSSATSLEISPITGPKMSFTSELTIAVKAAPKE